MGLHVMYLYFPDTPRAQKLLKISSYVFWALYGFLLQGIFTFVEAVLFKWSVVCSTVTQLHTLCQHTQHSQH
jgi:hypothetical protein